MEADDRDRSRAWHQTVGAQVADLHSREALIGRHVACVINLSPRRILSFLFEVLTFGLPDNDGWVVLVAPERTMLTGSKLF